MLVNVLMLPADFAERFRAELLGRYGDAMNPLHEAIAYVLSGPGKLVRPRLVLASALSASASPEDQVWKCAMPAMLAVEMVHCYSLVHDDLPAMDNDDYRRGRLSCHKKFGEAVAILVGDALIADAFDVLSSAQENALLQTRELAKAIGSSGMVLGQHRDIIAASKQMSYDKWIEVHQLKTGRLFEAACVLGGLSVGAEDNKMSTLREYARAFGLAFQLRDDLKDDDATVALLGRVLVEELLEQTVARTAELSRDLKSDVLLDLATFCS
jgi:geranylgeranyl diphosphate synthase type II